MTPLVHFLADRHEIMVGDVTFTGDVALDGRVTIAGRTVRPLTLGERDHLVARASGPDRTQEVARFVGDAATDGNPDPAGEVRAAVEAVALELAGASMAGPLTRTLLLVARAMGGPSEAVMAMNARDADQLAATLGAALANRTRRQENPTDDGWTTLAYHPTRAHTDSPGDRATAAGTRDRLAARLVARADELLDPDDVAALLGTEATTRDDGSAVEPDAPASGTQLSASDGDRWQPRSSTPAAPGADDRWHHEPSTPPAVGLDDSRPAVGPDESRPAMASATVPTAGVSGSSTAVASGEPLDDSTPTAQTASASSTDNGVPATPSGGAPRWSAARRPEPRPTPIPGAAPLRPAHDVRAGHVGTTRHPRPYASPPTAATPGTALRQRVEHPGSSDTTRLSAPELRRASGARGAGSDAGFDMTVVALALHEAADRRGLPR